jgi:signal transduction histidine kinase
MESRLGVHGMTDPRKMDTKASPLESYRLVLADYLADQTEAVLYQASLLSRQFVEQGVGPEEIVALHVEAFDLATEHQPYRSRLQSSADGLQFLLEVMIAYGMQHQAYMELRLTELHHQAEATADLERQRAAQAEQAEQEKVELLATIAHELGTPLTAARGYVDYAQRLIRGGRLEAVPAALGSAREAMDRLSHLTADLVRSSRGDELTLEFASLDLAEVLARACAWAQQATGEKAVEVRYAPEGQPVRLTGNADALLTIFGNLLSNAIRYTPDGGAVDVRLRQGGSDVCVEVQDTGIGMAPEVQTRIFDKFYRAGEARRMSAAGLGLGLALSQNLVTAHGGTITVESTPGVGSTFRVVLPAQADKKEEQGRGTDAE